MSKKLEDYIPVVAESGLITNKNATFGGNVTITGTLSAGSETTTAQVITANTANSFTVGPNGTTAPSLNVDASASVGVTGLNIKNGADGAGIQIAGISGGTNCDVYIDAKAAGAILFNRKNNNSASTVAVQGTNANTFFVSTTGSTTNTLFNVDASTGSAVAGLTIKGAATGGTVALSATDTGSNTSLSIAAKGNGTVTFNPAVVAAAGGQAQSGIQYGSINVGLFTGTGAPTFSAMNGSIYTDSNATTTTTRIYVNKSGAGTAGTTWTALTTAA